MKSSGFKTQNKKESGLRSTPIWATNPYSDSTGRGGTTYIHCPIYLRHRFIVCWELVDLNPVTDQFTCDFNFKFGQLTLGNGIRFGNYGNDVHLERNRVLRSSQLCAGEFSQVCNTTYKNLKVLNKSTGFIWQPSHLH